MAWLAFASFHNYVNIRKSQIKPWLKARYLILSISSTLFTLEGFFLLLLVINSLQIVIFLIYLSVAVVTLFSLGNFVCWVVPVFHHLDKISKKNDKLQDLEEKDIISDIKSQLSEGES